MARRPAGTIVQQLRQRIDAEAGADRPDAELLARFAGQRDEAAFAALVARHGPMVLRLCRHVLRCEQDAEDAFQATFLVLARTAGSIRRGESLGSWLYGVARRVALRAGRAAARRRRREAGVSDMPADDPAAVAALRELQAVLDEEVSRLPPKYRGPFVLCCLEGRSRDEAAAELGWNRGTLSGRLAQARLLLRRRLARRGVTLTAGLAAAAIGPAAVPPLLAANTLQAALAFAARQAAPATAAALATGVLRILAVVRLRRLAVLLAALVLLPGSAGLAVLRGWTAADDGPAPAATLPVAAAVEPAPSRTDRYGDPLPDAAVRRFGTLRLRQCSAVAFAPDGKQIVTGGGAKGAEVVFWERSSGRELRRLPAGAGVLDVQFSPDGRSLAAMTGTVVTNPVWDVATGKARFTFKGEFGAFSADGRSLLGLRAGDHGPIVGRWEVATGKQAGEWTLPGGGWGLACSPDGKTVAYRHDDALIVYDVEQRTERWRRAGTKMHAAAFSPDGRRLVAWGMPGLCVWEVATGRQEFSWERYGHVAAFSADSRRLAWTGADERGIPHPWAIDLGAGAGAGAGAPRRLGLPIGSLHTHLALSPDGGTLAAPSDGGALELRDTATGKDVLPLDGNTGRIFGLRQSPDGRFLATADIYRVLVWDRTTGKLLRRFPEEGSSIEKGQRPMVWDVGLTADGGLRRDPQRCPDGHWDFPATEALPRLRKLRLSDGKSDFAFANFEGMIVDVLESPDRRYLAVRVSAQRPGFADRNAPITIRVWDTQTGRPLDHLRTPGGHLLGAFSSDNRLLVTTGPQGTVHLWELATGGERLTLHGHLPGSVRAALFTPDQRFLLTGGDDSQVLQWDLTGRARDGVWRTTRHEPKRQAELWSQLASADAAVANGAIWELAADPAGTVSFLQARLKPVTGPAERDLADLVAQLGADDFATRQSAHARLTELGESAAPALRQALTKSVPLEQKRRIEALLHELAPPAPAGDVLRSLRAVEVLERIATADARRLTGQLAQGLPGTRLTQAARAALDRLEIP